MASPETVHIHRTSKRAPRLGGAERGGPLRQGAHAQADAGRAVGGGARDMRPDQEGCAHGCSDASMGDWGLCVRGRATAGLAIRGRGSRSVNYCYKRAK